METTTAQTYLGLDDRYLRLIGIPVSAALIPIVFFDDMPYNALLYLHTLIYTVVTWEGVRGIFIAVTRRFPDFEQWRQRMGWIAAGCIVYVGLTCTLVGILTMILLPQAWVLKREPNVLDSYIASYTMLLLVGGMYESMRFFTLWKETLLEKEQVERAHLTGQLEGLRNQVNPHFLFNSLNTLVYLIPEEPERAVRFVRQLSKVYRYVLESRDAQLISLREELTFLEAYVFLLRERFGDNLRVDLRTDTLPPETAIVPLTLQLLFENAIKHNIISADKPLHIVVYPEGNTLVVRNTLQRKQQVTDSTGVGLENIRLRYRILTGQAVMVVETDGYFKVVLPMGDELGSGKGEEVVDDRLVGGF